MVFGTSLQYINNVAYQIVKNQVNDKEDIVQFWDIYISCGWSWTYCFSDAPHNKWHITAILAVTAGGWMELMLGLL